MINCQVYLQFVLTNTTSASRQALARSDTPNVLMQGQMHKEVHQATAIQSDKYVLHPDRFTYHGV